MPVVLPSAVPELETMLSHSWLADDQKAAFSASPFVYSDLSVSNYLSPWLTGAGYKSSTVRTIYIQDVQVAFCLMNQALEFLQKALCNTVAHYILAQKGLETWARVTNYYASYFCVHSLLCLQGRTITRLQLDKIVAVQIVPIDFRSHIFAITTRHLGKNPHHDTPWRRFYDIYDRYAVPHQAYELVARKAYVSDPTDEVIERNAINYTPFKGFREIQDLAQHQGFSNLFADYISDLKEKTSLDEFLVDLRGFASDPDHKYFARTLLKIAFAAAIILLIRSASAGIEVAWLTMTQRWQEFLATVFPIPDDCYLLKFVPLVGSE